MKNIKIKFFVFGLIFGLVLCGIYNLTIEDKNILADQANMPLDEVTGQNKTKIDKILILILSSDIDYEETARAFCKLGWASKDAGLAYLSGKNEVDSKANSSCESEISKCDRIEIGDKIYKNNDIRLLIKGHKEKILEGLRKDKINAKKFHDCVEKLPEFIKTISKATCGMNQENIKDMIGSALKKFGEDKKDQELGIKHAGWLARSAFRLHDLKHSTNTLSQ